MTILPVIGYNVIMSRQWIGLIGQNGSGKSTVCGYLANLGYHVLSLSDVVRNHADHIGEKQDRDTLTRLSNQLKKDYGLDYFAKECVAQMQLEAVDNVVFDSVRHPDEVNYLLNFNTVFIGVEATVETRYDRIQIRKNSTDFISFDVFKQQDDYEFSGNSTGQSIHNCLKLCKFKINNDGEEDELYNNIDQVLKRI